MEEDELKINMKSLQREITAAMTTIKKLLKDLNQLREENEQLKATIAKLATTTLKVTK